MFGIETCFFTAAAAKKVVAKRGNQDVQETLRGSGFDYISIFRRWVCGWHSLLAICMLSTRVKNLWTRWKSRVNQLTDSRWMESFFLMDITILFTSPSHSMLVSFVQ